MKTQLWIVAALMIAPIPSAYAQGIIGGAQEGSQDGARAAGPVGGLVGGVLGGVAGGINGLLGGEQRPRFHEYVVREKHPSHQYQGALDVGAELPDQGVTYYEVPAE